jgi:hypothetical protein
MNLHETAIRNKYRFPSTKGSLTLEQLYDLPLLSKQGACLNNIALTLYQELKESPTVSFVSQTTTAVNSVLSNKLDLVKHIISIKEEENAAARLVSDNKTKKSRILEILASKQDEALINKTEEELLKLAESL